MNCDQIDSLKTNKKIKKYSKTENENVFQNNFYDSRY